MTIGKIYQTTDRRNRRPFVVRYQLDGETRSQSFPLKRDADRYAKELRDRRDRGLVGDTGRTFADAAAAFLKTWEVRVADGEIKASTVDGYRYALNHATPVLGSIRVANIAGSHVVVVRDKLAASGLAPRTRAGVLKTISLVLDHEVELGHRDSNPARSVRKPEVSRIREPQTLTPAEVDRIAEAIDPEYRAAVYLGAYLGLHWSEVFAIKPGDFDLDAGTVTLRRMLEKDGTAGRMKTRYRAATLAIPARVQLEVRRHFRDHAGTVWFFQGREEGPRSYGAFRRGAWSRAIAAADLDGVRFSDLRHSFSSWVEEAKRDGSVTELDHAVLMRHSTVKTSLDVYTARPRTVENPL